MKKKLSIVIIAIFLINIILSTFGLLSVFSYSNNIDETGWVLKDGAVSITSNTDVAFITEGTTSMQLFYEMGQNGKPDYATIERNISNVQDKSLHFKVYNRNGAGVGIFKVKAIAYDESGVAHDLGSYPDDGNLGWSWPTNWFTYEKALPTGVVINKIRIQLINNNTAQTPAFGPSGPGENWIFIDDLKMVDVVDTTGIGENNWYISDGAISLTPNTDTNYITEGATSMQLFYEMGQNGKPDYATIEKSITNVQNKKLHFKLFNRNGAANGIFKIKAIAYDLDNIAYDIGSYPDDGRLGFSPEAGWYSYDKPLPTGKVINKIRIQLINDNIAQAPTLGPGNAGENWVFIDDLKMLDVLDTSGIGEDNWTCLDGTLKIDINTEATYISDGTTSMQLFYEMGQNGKPQYATIEKTIQNTQDKKLHFKIWNRNGAANGIFKVLVTAISTEGAYYELSLFPEVGRLGWSGGGTEVADGWYVVENKLPEGIIINKIQIQLINDNPTQAPKLGSGVAGENWIYIDDVKFVDNTNENPGGDPSGETQVGLLGEDKWSVLDGALSIVSNTEQTFVTEGTTSMKVDYEMGQNGKPQYATIKKDILPVIGGKIHFKLWNRNGAANGSFKMKAIVYDSKGQAYELTPSPADNGSRLGWSGSTPTDGEGFYTYEQALPSNIIINKITIRIVNDNTAQSEKLGPGNIGENWVYIDDVRLIDSDPQYTLFDETGWNVKDGALLIEKNSNKAFVYDGDSSMKMYYEMGVDGKPQYATIERSVAPQKGGKFAYQLWNRNGAANGAFKLGAKAVAEDGTVYDLGYIPDQEGSRIGWSGGGSPGTEASGWYNYIGDIPADVTINKIRIELLNDNTAQVPFFDDVDGPGENWVFIDGIVLYKADANTAGSGVDTQPVANDANDVPLIDVDDSIDNYENHGKYPLGERDWSLGGSGSILTINSSKEYINDGNTSIKLYYDFTNDNSSEVAYIEKQTLPLLGGRISFKVFNINSAPIQSFDLKAIGYDKNGTSYDLRINPQNTALGYSGNKDIQGVGWLTYTGTLPSKVSITKIQIQLLKTKATGSIVENENIIYFDDIHVMDTTIVNPNTKDVNVFVYVLLSMISLLAIITLKAKKQKQSNKISYI